MDGDTFAQLRKRIDRLVKRRDAEGAIRAIEKWINDYPNSEAMPDARKLLTTLEGQRMATRQTAAREERLARARTYQKGGDKLTAFGLLQNLLQERPDDEEVLRTLHELTQDFPDMTGDVILLLQAMPSNHAITAALARLQEQPPPEVEKRAEAAPSAQAEELLGQGMKFYRTLHHPEALEIFDRLLREEPEGSKVYKEAFEYRRKAEDALARGEVPLGDLPQQAVLLFSQARGFFRLGYYAKAAEQLRQAMELCKQAGKGGPGGWTALFEEADLFARAQEMEEEGLQVLRTSDDWEKVIDLWTRASVAMRDQDAILKDRLESLKKVNETLAQVNATASLPVGDIEAQARTLIQVFADLRDISVKFPASQLVKQAHELVRQKAHEVVAALQQRGEESENRCQTATSLESRRAWADQAAQWYGLGAQLNPEDTDLMMKTLLARETSGRCQARAADLGEAERLMASESIEVLQDAQRLLERVGEACATDPDLRLLVRRLEARYVQLFQQSVASSRIEDAREVVTILRSPFFEPLSPRAVYWLDGIDKAAARIRWTALLDRFRRQ